MTAKTRDRLGVVCGNEDDAFLRLFDLVEAHLGSDRQESVFREFSLKVGENLHVPARYVLTCTEPISAPSASELEKIFEKVSSVLQGMQAPESVYEWAADNFGRNPSVIFAHSSQRTTSSMKFYMATPNDQRFLTPFKNVLGRKSRHCPALMGLEWRPGSRSTEFREYYQIHIGSTEDLGRFLTDQWIEESGWKEGLIDELLRLVDDQWCCASPLIQYKNDIPTQLQISFKCDCVPDTDAHSWGASRRNLSEIAEPFMKIGGRFGFDLNRLEGWFRAAGDCRLTWLGLDRFYPPVFNLYCEL